MSSTRANKASSDAHGGAGWRRVALATAALVLIQWMLMIAWAWSVHLHSDTPPSDNLFHSCIDGRSGDSKESRGGDIIQYRAMDSFRSDEAAKSDLPSGVAVSLLLKAPKWFHRRYVVMIHNALNNIPENWKIQLVVNQPWINKDVYPFHPGLARLLEDHPRIITTTLPKNMTRFKPKQIYKSEWFWSSLQAEHVLLFGGNGAFCANKRVEVDWKTFLSYDYVGVPWNRFQGQGGDASSHSFRRRSAMLRILRENPPGSNEDIDSVFFVRHMVSEASKNQYKLPGPEVTHLFGGVDMNGVVEPYKVPLVLSGTLAHLNWTSRDAVLNICPELKVIFPSLHEPSCFGAHPNGERCTATICALQEQLPASGC